MVSVGLRGVEEVGKAVRVRAEPLMLSMAAWVLVEMTAGSRKRNVPEA